MSQWQQPGGYQYPMQTGYPAGNPQFQQQNPQFQQQQQPQNPQFQQQNPQFLQQNPQQQLGGGLLPQRTGYVPPQNFQQPQQTGFGGGAQPGFLQSQPTGYMGGNFQQRAAPPPPPVPAMPPQFQGQGSNFLAPQQPNRSFLNTSPGPGLVPQATGFPGQRPLVAQPTGFVDPRLQMMSSSFMPMNVSSPYGAGGAPQFQPQNSGVSLQQSFQQVTAQKPRISWALGKAEKKSYDAIFRAWDSQNTGFINGQTALDVFAQSGLSKDDLARVWTLADIDDRGKLNLAEFHVAMGLIYRKLNGNEIPDKLPPELEPPSSKQLGESVDLVRDLLKHETRSRTPNTESSPLSYRPNRSFTENTNGGSDPSRDATVYRYPDSSSASAYQPRSRHVDRDAVRATSDMDSPSADLSDMKRALANTAAMLDRAAESDRSRTAEDEALEREMEDLKYRVKRINEDLEYASRGPRSVAKDDERRKLERELLELMHVRVPEVERRMKAREDRRDKEKRDAVRARDERNERFGRFGDRDDSRERYNRDRDRYDDRDRDRPYSRGGYRRDDREFEGGSYRPRSPARRDSDRDDRRDYDRPRSTAPSDYDRPRSTAPPDVPPLPTQSRAAVTPSPAPTKAMTPEERRAEARRRVDARMAALGVAPSPSATPAVDSSIEERLAQEKKEAEEKARVASVQAEEREAARRERLEREKAMREGKEVPTPTSAPTPTASAPPPRPTPTPKSAPPPPMSKPKTAPPPPKPRVPRAAPAPVPAPAPPVVVSPPTAPAGDPEEEALRRREEAIMKQREARAERLRQLEREEEEAERAAKAEEERRAQNAKAEEERRVRESRAERLRQLEKEEEEAARAEEERIQARIRARTASAGTPSASTTSSVMSLSTRSPSPVMVVAPTPPPAPVQVTTPPEVKSSTNPFSRLMKESGGTPPVASAPATNPWAASSNSTPTAVSPPPVSAPRNNPFPAPVKTPYNVAPASDDGDWDVIKEHDDDDSSDEDNSRDMRKNLAKELFGSILPSAPIPRPQSAAANSRSGTPATPSAGGAPPPPPPPPGPPPPPMAPPAPLAAPAAAPAAPGDVSALMKSIQGGMKLRKAVTVDKSGPPVSGKVLGDTAPPAHINLALASVPEPPMVSSTPSSNSNRQSVDWYGGLASDTVPPSATALDRLPPMKEEHEYDEPYAPAPVPDINVVEPEPVSDLMADIDKSREIRVRSLYAYEGDGTEDITFAEHVILIANPSKTGGDWWYGKSLRDGASGLFPKAYVQEITTLHAKGMYDYTASNSDELSFSAGEVLSIVDTSEEEWWKAERDGAVFIVPAGYLEVAEVGIAGQMRSVSPAAIEAPPVAAETTKPRIEEGLEIDSDGSESESDESESESESDYLSFDESDEEDEADSAAREHERQLVLEAAGLIVKKDVQPPPRPVRRRSARRPPPAAPDRSSVLSSSSSVVAKELPPIPEPDAATRLDDAFDRYEAYRGHHQNRLSVASVETNPPMPSSPTSPSGMTPSASAGSEGGRTSGFLHFLGRKTPNEAEGGARPRPIISGPIAIPRPDSSGGSRSNSPAFGSSWASLVDKSALEGIPPQERRRQEAIFELIATENTYVRDLQLIVETFYSSMMPLLDRKAITVVFANIEDILLTNTTFMSSLEERQKECRLYVDRIGDILQNHMSNMAVYMEYCVNQGTAIKVLKSLRDSNPELAGHLQRLKEDPNVRNLDLSSYLLAPMQRITRYPLLIKQILHYTEPGDEHKAIQKSVGISEKILDHINESIRDQEGRETLKRISENLWIGQGRLDLTAPTRHMGMRRLIREGPLVKSKSGRKLYGFLCSDILVLTDGSMKTLYRMPIPLGEAQVKDVPGGRDDMTFQISLPYPRGGEAIALRASSVRDCQLWMNGIEAASKKCLEAEKRAARKIPSA
ncbi:hypothetical protein K438DRAFT_1953239 [Mycena galopus ATCC 62051]|nr:hypothetical protein K438DRAFT_1953239 [Mycena galopus ATCC 62051]